MLDQDQINQEASPALRRVQLVGFILYFSLMAAIAADIVRGYRTLGNPWVVILTAIVGYLVADLLSGIVHFLADNFGSPETPLLGPGFVLPFRQHHVDPLGITRHGFLDANGNNALVCIPFLIPFVLFVPVTTSEIGYAAGVFTFVTLFAVFLTNQTHKWAHMDHPPRVVEWMQSAGLVLSKSHHEIHHKSPFNTHYCITVGAWNSLFERYRVFDRFERIIRRWVPGIDPRTRMEQDAQELAMMGTQTTQ